MGNPSTVDTPSPNELIITTHPTQLDIDRAEHQQKMVMVFVQLSDEMMKLAGEVAERFGEYAMQALRQAWMYGFLHGCGIKPSEYVCIHTVPHELDLESVVRAYQNKWVEMRESWMIEPVAFTTRCGMRACTITAEVRPVLASALHAGAPPGHMCSDCAIDGEPCPACYHAAWRRRHPNVKEPV